MKKFVFVVLFVVLVSGLVGCAPSAIEARNSAVNSTGPSTYQVHNFVERSNIDKRQKLFDNLALVSWIYCLSQTGTVIFYGPVQGKVTSSGKRLEPIQASGTNGYANFTYPDGSIVATDELMQQDGTFGTSDSYVYWYDPAGNYYQWGGQYFLTSVPISVNESVLNVRSVQP